MRVFLFIYFLFFGIFMYSLFNFSYNIFFYIPLWKKKANGLYDDAISQVYDQNIDQRAN